MAKDFKANKRDLIFAIANEEDFEADIKLLGLSETGGDVAVGIWALGNIRYPMKDDDIDADSLRTFVEAFIKGKLKPRINTEPKPKWSKNALIHKVVGSTFENVVLNPAKNVIVKLCFPIIKTARRLRLTAKRLPLGSRDRRRSYLRLGSRRMESCWLICTLVKTRVRQYKCHRNLRTRQIWCSS